MEETRQLGLSIVIPAYNAANHLSRSINSVLRQTCRNLEIILIDDGSTDNTKSRAEELLENADFPWTIHTQSNKGVSIARNVGMEMSRGKFVHFLDSDDEIDCRFVEKMLSTAETSGSDITLCGQEVIAAGEETPEAVFNCFPITNPKSNVVNNRILIEHILYSKLSLNTGAFLFLRQFLRNHKLLFTSGCQHGEDREFIVKALLDARKVSVVKDLLFRYILVSESLSQVVSLRRFEDVASYLRLAKYLERESPEAEFHMIIRNYVVPVRITSAMEYLALHGYNKEELKVIARNPSILKLLRRFRVKTQVTNSLKEWLRCKLLLLSPRLFFMVFSLKKGPAVRLHQHE